MTSETFFEWLYEYCDLGGIEIRALNGAPKYGRPRMGWGHDGSGPNPAAAAELATEYGREQNVYFGVATRAIGCSKKEDIVQIPALWVDIDMKDGADPHEYVRLVRTFPLAPSAIVFTGGGWHIYWRFSEPVEPVVGKVSITRVEAILRGLARSLGGDMASTDASRILRVPETMNRKYDPPRRAQVIECSYTEYSLGDFDDYAVDEIAPNGNSPSREAKFAMIWHWCSFMRHCERNATTLSEGEWYAMISNLARLPGGVTKIHDLSRPYPRYSRRETDQKILKAVDNSYPIACSTIARVWPGCSGCKAGVKAPCRIYKEIE